MMTLRRWIMNVVLVLLVLGPSFDGIAQETARRCLGLDARGPELSSEFDALTTSMSRIEASPELGGYFSTLLSDNDISVCVDPAISECRGYYEPETNVIAIQDGLSSDVMVLILIHELRHVDQYQRGFAPSLAYDMREIARQTYALEADAQAITALFAWLERSQDSKLWKTFLDLPHYGDIAEAFEEAITSGEGEAVAVRAAFKAWYRSDWRRNNYYLESCAAYLDQLDAEHAIRRYRLLPEDYFDSLCLMPTGTNYECHLTDKVSGIGVGSEGG